jgi:hypothetical protein
VRRKSKTKPARAAIAARRTSTPRHIPQSAVPGQLLFSRAQAAKLLGGLSFATLIRLEKAGRLRPVKLLNNPSGKTFYTARDLEALCGTDGESSRNDERAR